MSPLEWLEALQLLPSIVQTVESIYANVTKSDTTSVQKLSSAVSILAAAVPAVGQSLQTQPATVTHVQSVINSVVAATNAANAVMAQQQQQQAASGA